MPNHIPRDAAPHASDIAQIHISEATRAFIDAHAGEDPRDLALHANVAHAERVQVVCGERAQLRLAFHIHRLVELLRERPEIHAQAPCQVHKPRGVRQAGDELTGQPGLGARGELRRALLHRHTRGVDHTAARRPRGHCTPDVLALRDELLAKAPVVMIKLSPMLDWRKTVEDFGGGGGGGGLRTAMFACVTPSSSALSSRLPMPPVRAISNARPGTAPTGCSPTNRWLFGPICARPGHCRCSAANAPARGLHGQRVQGAAAHAHARAAW